MKPLLDWQQTAEGILFTDQYELTMAQFYYRLGFHEQLVQFDYFFRHYPDYGSHQAGYCVNAGLEWLLDWLQRVRLTEKDLEYLRALKNRAGKPLFADDFLKWFSSNGNFESLSLRAIPEGRVVHPLEPLTVVTGPLAIAQLLETALLNYLNYQTLVATKAARIKDVCKSSLFVDFGVRRGQAMGANAGTRAAMIGGADFTSNTGLSCWLGYPPKGTHAHSLVQLFLAQGYSELDAFRAFSEVYPDDCNLLVDTVNTLESGLPNAIKVFEELRRKGHNPVGIRLDSGDLAYLAIQAAWMLDSAGFTQTTITLSNELDELTIWKIRNQILTQARHYGVDPEHLLSRLVYGVGTRLITSSGCPALDGVYKLVAVKKGEQWLPTLKISDSPAKILNPGNKLVWRAYDIHGKAFADFLSLADVTLGRVADLKLYDAHSLTNFPKIEASRIHTIEPLHVEVLQHGHQVSPSPTLQELRNRRIADMANLKDGVKRLVKPDVYPVVLTENLYNLKQQLILALRSKQGV